MGNWTPGPWRTSESGLRMIVRSEDGRIIAVRHRIGAIEHEANARLIAAAPELLDALRRAVIALAFAAETLPVMQDAYEDVSAAIAKATGTQP